ncbi:MAG TPA: glycan-binding surface protein [Prolixibacteraceae bacterium]|nr:glycan-binding surface protein [Prolixibacteraceae bacterium]
MKTIKKFTIYLLLSVAVVGAVFTSCKDDSEDSGKTPVVKYVRITNPDSSDSLVVSAYMGSLIAIMGEDLQGIRELWFNDQKAKLNPAYITSFSVLVSVPSVIPETVTDEITMKFNDGKTLVYSFKVDVPAPMLSSLLCEYVKAGDTAIISGNYFLPAEGLEEPVVYFPNNIKAQTIISYTMDEIQVIVPSEAGVGKITVESMYGSTRSDFIFRDNTNLILDFENSAYGNPWGLGGFGTENGCSGQYLQFVGNQGAWNWVNPMMFGYWAKYGAGENPIAEGLVDNLELCFETNIVEWSDVPMLIWFDKIGTADGVNPDGVSAQAHWKPFNKDGVKSTYSSGGWITVSIPLTDFIYNKDESKSDLKIDNISLYSNLSFMLFGSSDATYPIDIRIDNVRVVPLKNK